MPPDPQVSLTWHPTAGCSNSFTCGFSVSSRESCKDIPFDVPVKVPKEVCEKVPKQKCEKIPKKIPKKVPEEVCDYHEPHGYGYGHGYGHGHGFGGF